MKFFDTALAGLTALAISGPALAADLPSRKAPVVEPPPPAFTWNGLYAGLNTGYAWGGSSGTQVVSAPAFDAGFGGSTPFLLTQNMLAGTNGAGSSGAGWLIGGQIGYNAQFNNIVAGLETDIQGVIGSRGSQSWSGALLIPGFAQSAVSSANAARKIDFFGALRARLGWLVTPSWLLYATGGMAYGGVNASTNVVQALVPNSIATPVWGSAGAFSGLRVGWTIGAGVEWMFSSNWSVKAEYFYYDLGRVSYAGSPMVTLGGGPFTIAAVNSSTRFNGNVVRLGVNYHFSWGNAPVVGRY